VPQRCSCMRNHISTDVRPIEWARALVIVMRKASLLPVLFEGTCPTLSLAPNSLAPRTRPPSRPGTSSASCLVVSPQQTGTSSPQPKPSRIQPSITRTIVASTRAESLPLPAPCPPPSSRGHLHRTRVWPAGSLNKARCRGSRLDLHPCRH